MFTTLAIPLLLLLPATIQAFGWAGGRRQMISDLPSHTSSAAENEALLQGPVESSSRSNFFASAICGATRRAADNEVSLQGPVESSSRRNFFASICGAVFFAANQPPIASAASTVRVAEWPSLAYLEPLFELSLSVDALAKTVGDTSRWPVVQKRLEKFFKGALLSEKNYYSGVAIMYMNEIKYDPSETSEFIKIDKSKRYDAFEACLKNLELLKNDIAANEGLDNVKADAEAAQRALTEWFSYVPQEDVAAIGKLFVAVKSADADRNGKLDAQELQSLSDEDRAVWKKRVELFGDI